LTVLGDVLESILRALDAANRGKGKDDQASALAEEKSLLKRPWTEVLAVNRSHWQKKHDSGEETALDSLRDEQDFAGEKGIEPSGAEADPRPTSVTSITGSKSRPGSAATIASRPSTAASSSSTPSKPAASQTAAKRLNNNHVMSAAKGHLERQVSGLTHARCGQLM